MHVKILPSTNLGFLLFTIFLSFGPKCLLFFRYEQEFVKGDTETMITASEHDGGYSLNYEARQNASKLNQAVKTINAFNKRIQVLALQLLPKLRGNF